MGRPLWLHISALSPDEYEAYPPALEDIASFGQDDAKGDWESQSVSLLVAKGWMKGRYRDQLEGDVVDKVCGNYQCLLHPSRSLIWPCHVARFYAISIPSQYKQTVFQPVNFLLRSG
jgi:hypothetical protein